MKFFSLLLILFAYYASADDCLIEAQQIINNIRSFQADFLEEKEGKRSEGRIFVKKPGLMRLDYLNPEKVSIFLKDDIITHYDYELEEVSYLKNQDASFLAKDQIDLMKDFEKSLCKKEGNKIKLLVKKKDWLVELILEDKKLLGFTSFAEGELLSKVFFVKEVINLQLSNDIFTYKDKKFFSHD